MALGLPMTAEELEAARLQEEERKAQLNAKAEKLLRTQANLKRLELRKAEKRLLTLQSAKDQSANLEDVRHQTLDHSFSGVTDGLSGRSGSGHRAASETAAGVHPGPVAFTTSTSS